MMRLIHDQPVRSPRPHPQLLQPGHQSRKKRGPLRQWYVMEDPIAKNQIELLLRKIFGGGC